MYAQMSDNTAGQPEAMMRATQARLPAGASAATAPSIAGAYAEIGPDIGLFTGMCAQSGQVSIYHLFEPNRGGHGATCRTSNRRSEPAASIPAWIRLAEIPDGLSLEVKEW